MKAGQVKMWLDQGPAVLLEQCEVEGEAIALGEVDDVGDVHVEEEGALRRRGGRRGEGARRRQRGEGRRGRRGDHGGGGGRARARW